MGTRVRVYHVPEQDKWCVTWRTPTMPASSFWYFDCLSDAVHAMREMGWEPTWI